jgi:hypothetical protein
MQRWRFLVCVSLIAGCGLSSGRTSSDLGSGDVVAPTDDIGTTATDDIGTLNRDAACFQTAFRGEVTKRPIDIIMVVDNSGSMDQEIAGVEKNIDRKSVV